MRREYIYIPIYCNFTLFLLAKPLQKQRKQENKENKKLVACNHKNHTKSHVKIGNIINNKPKRCLPTQHDNNNTSFHQ